MKRSIIIILTTVVLISCDFSNNTELQKLDEPQVKWMNAFSIKQNGPIIFQMYQEYGFSDVEKHMILVTHPNSKPNDFTKLPISKSDLLRLHKISRSKYGVDSNIIYDSDINTNSDIRNNGYIYSSKTIINPFPLNSLYRVTINDGTEKVELYDSKTNTLLIESKK